MTGRFASLVLSLCVLRAARWIGRTLLLPAALVAVDGFAVAHPLDLLCAVQSLQAAIMSTFGTLNTQQTIVVKASLARIRLQENYKSTDNLVFWGRVSGSIKDYLIIQATVTKESQIEKRYYFRCTLAGALPAHDQSAEALLFAASMAA